MIVTRFSNYENCSENHRSRIKMDFLGTLPFIRNRITHGLVIFSLLQVMGTNVTAKSDDASQIGNTTGSSTFQSYDSNIDTSTSFSSLMPQTSTESNALLFSTENISTLEVSESITNSTELPNTTIVITAEMSEYQTSISSTEQVTAGPIFNTTPTDNATWTTTSPISIEPISTTTATVPDSIETGHPNSHSMTENTSTTYSLITVNSSTSVPPTFDFSPEQFSQIATQLAQTEYQLNIITGVYLGIAFILVTIVICNSIAIRSIKQSLSETLTDVAENKKRPRDYTNSGIDRTSHILPYSNNNGGSPEDYSRFPYIGSQNPATERSMYNNFPMPQNRFNYLNPKNQKSLYAPPSTAHPNSTRNREFYDAYHHEWNKATN